MKQKLISILVFISIQVSSVAGQGYREALNQALNPSGLKEIRVMYETLGWPIAALVAVPLLVFFGYGYVVGMWERKKYWHLLVVTSFVSVIALVLFPLILYHI